MKTIINLHVGDLVRIVHPMSHPKISDNRTGVIIDKIKPSGPMSGARMTIFVVYFAQTQETLRLTPSSLEKI